MLDIINSQLKNPKTLVKSFFYQSYNSAEAHQITSDLYPLCNNYYHELNPAFLFQLNRPEFLEYSPLITVRDGSASFATFILRNFQLLPKIKTHFAIHEDLAPLVPANLKDQFSCWRISKKNQEISKAKKVLIFGILSQQALPSPEVLVKKLSALKDMSPTCEIEVHLPFRKAPLGNQWKESQAAYEIISMIKDMLPGRKLNFIMMRDIMERHQWRDIYCLNVISDKLLLTDSFLDHFISQRGGSVSTWSQHNQKNTVFDLDLSLNHKIEYFPLPEVPSLFADLIFYKKKTAGKDYMTDPVLHDLLRENNL